MKSRHSILPLAVMAAGTVGCFDTQRDETFADTVVHDDTEIRVLHASPDAPRLDLLLDGERKLQDLDYAQTRVLTPPADWYDVAVEGRTGPETLEPLLSPQFDRFDEDRRYDLLLAGSADGDENTLRALLLAWDEGEPEDGEEEDDESLSLRGAHLVESAGELDLFINGNDEPLTTLGYGEGSETLEIDEAVVSIRLQEPGSEELLFDSGKRERLSAGDALLVAVVPNTSVTSDEEGGSPVKVLLLNEDRVTTVRNQSEQSSLRFVHAAADFETLSFEVQPDSEGTSVFGPESAEYEEILPSSPADYAFLENGAFVAEAGETVNGDSVKKNVRFNRGHGRTLIALNDAEPELDLKSVQNNDRSVATNARVRVFNGSPLLNEADPVDVFLLNNGQGLAEEEGVIESPAFTSLNFRKMSRYEPVPSVPEGDYNLVVTPAGDTSRVLLEKAISVATGGIYDLVLAGDGDDETSDGPFQLIQIGGVPDS